MLRANGIVKGKYDGIKILGSGNLSKKLKFSVDKVSDSAKDKIEKAGGNISKKESMASASADE